MSTSTASASPRVEREDAEADVKVQVRDSLADVVERAVKKGRIEKILWKDVAGWKLLDSRDGDAKGRSSKPLLDLPQFPSKSLLILTRRPAPPITKSSALDDSGSSTSPPSRPNPEMIASLRRYYLSDVIVAEQFQSVDAISELCTRFENLPHTYTVHHFHEQGVTLGGPMLGHTDLLYTAVKNGNPLILKKLTAFELPGYNLIRELGRAEVVRHHLAPFDMFEAKSPAPASRATIPLAPASSLGHVSGPPPGRSLSQTPSGSIAPSAVVGARPSPLRSWVHMPRYSADLDTYPRPLDPQGASRIINQMLVALDFLHQHGIAHMDVKPGNILANDAGDFWLADFGSARSLGATSSSTTPSFVPQDRRFADGDQYRVSREHDLWMLAMTITYMLSQRPDDQVGAGAIDFSMDQVAEAINRLNTDEARQLLALLRATASETSGMRKK